MLFFVEAFKWGGHGAGIVPDDDDDDDALPEKARAEQVRVNGMLLDEVDATATQANALAMMFSGGVSADWNLGRHEVLHAALERGLAELAHDFAIASDQEGDVEFTVSEALSVPNFGLLLIGRKANPSAPLPKRMRVVRHGISIDIVQEETNATGGSTTLSFKPSQPIERAGVDAQLATLVPFQLAGPSLPPAWSGTLGDLKAWGQAPPSRRRSQARRDEHFQHLRAERRVSALLLMFGMLVWEANKDDKPTTGGAKLYFGASVFHALMSQHPGAPLGMRSRLIQQSPEWAAIVKLLRTWRKGSSDAKLVTAVHDLDLVDALDPVLGSVRRTGTTRRFRYDLEDNATAIVQHTVGELPGKVQFRVVDCV